MNALTAVSPADAVPTRRFALPGGGHLAYALYGDPGGRPVHFFHGFPNSRLLAAMVHGKAQAAGVCLVAADRPGFGESSPQACRSIADWPGQVLALADHLGQAKIDLIGVSCGGPYALACAAAMPGRLGRVAMVAGMGAMDDPALRAGQMPALRLMFALARLQPWLASPMFLLDRAVFRGDPARALRMVSSLLAGPDRQVLEAHPDVGRHFVASMAEAYRQGIGAAMQEARLIARPRPFDLAGIRVPVRVFQGRHDRHVPEAMGRHLADAIPGATWHPCPDDGHLSILWTQFDRVLASLA